MDYFHLFLYKIFFFSFHIVTKFSEHLPNIVMCYLNGLNGVENKLNGVQIKLLGSSACCISITALETVIFVIYHKCLVIPNVHYQSA